MSDYKYVNGQRFEMDADEVSSLQSNNIFLPEYIANRINAPEATNRENAYPGIYSQLDMLWHDIDNGLFGEQAKTGNFYQTLQNVKTSNPKA